MKLRQGFVSNSSSSSFLIVGVQGFTAQRIFNQLKDEDKDNDYYMDGYGKWNVDLPNVTGWGSFGEDYPEYIGIDAEDKLNKNLTVQDIKNDFIKTLRDNNIEIDESKVKLFYGEASSE